MFDQLRHFFWRMGLPQSWTSARSFVVVIPITKSSVKMAENGLRQAAKHRDPLMRVCQELLWDEIFQRIDARRRAKIPLNDEELKYVMQADKNYLEMVTDKMHIAIFYDGDYFALPESDRSALCRLSERLPGSSVVSSLSVFGGRRLFTIDPKREITSAHAERNIRKWLRDRHL